MKFYVVEEDRTAGFTGNLTVRFPWGFPGVTACETCGAAGGWAGLQYPCVDLSEFPERTALENPGRQVSFEEFRRLRDLVSPFAPPGARLEPGADFGPPTGTGTGTFGDFFLQNPWSLYIRREALERLQGEGLRGLSGCPVNVKFRGKSPPYLLAMQLKFQGRLRGEHVSAQENAPCPKCGSSRHTMPQLPSFDVRTMSDAPDLFRLSDWPTLIMASQRMVTVVRQLAMTGVRFVEPTT
ncbi:double-CXXCG motif protein [Myxococcus hansupus]|uniref:SitI6 family double-CXXCG motif immunity protein n=1 Tax=Pseudomyxococcus hansupus TaxID=1297742 RepID=UPI0005D124F1|nr:double-CXXCG motif protein [Myxococcus hansupus]